MSIHSTRWIVSVSACFVLAGSASAQQRCDAAGPCETAAPARPVPLEIRSTIEGEDVVRTARRYLGVPYVLGGTTPKAFDCSGFVRWVFAQHGIAMPRTARQQAGLGEAPRAGEPLQPGDLLFFHGGNGAQHIAMYVGRDTIIHASSRSRRVKLDRFSGKYNPNSSWFGERLIAVRRILPAEGVYYLPTARSTPTTGVVASSASSEELSSRSPTVRQ